MVLKRSNSSINSIYLACSFISTNLSYDSIIIPSDVQANGNCDGIYSDQFTITLDK